MTPRNEAAQSAAMIICHGLGNTAEGFVDVVEHLSTSFPYVKFVLPTASTQKVMMNMGMTMPSWYDIVGLDSRSSNDTTTNDTTTLHHDIPTIYGPPVTDRRITQMFIVFCPFWKFHLSHPLIYFGSIMGNSPPVELISKIHCYGHIEPIHEAHNDVFL